MNLKKPYFVASSSMEAIAYKSEMENRYGSFSRDECDVIVALGGDGFMLQTLKSNKNSTKNNRL